MTSGCPVTQRATTVNQVVGVRPSWAVTASTSERPAIFGSAALVLDGALEVDLALLRLAHETLQLLFELGVAPAAAFDARLRVLERLDREVDLAVLLDGDDLGGHAIADVEVLLDAPNVVPIDLRDVDQ